MSRWKEFFSKSEISWPTYALICLFGLGSWIAVNGLWVELPVLVKDAPEKWNLPSYLAVIFQLANVGPVIYALGNHLAPAKVHEKSAIPFIVSIGAVACALLGFLLGRNKLHWRRKTQHCSLYPVVFLGHRGLHFLRGVSNFHVDVSFVLYECVICR